MSRTTGKKADAAGKGNPMLVGVLVGLIVGVGLAAGLAWYLMKSPSPFVSKEQVTVNKPQAEERIKAEASEVVKRGTAAQPASGVGDGKPRFEFYKVLTDKQDAAAKSPVAKPAADAGKPVYYLQAGAFANEAEAEKLKASLIIDGMEVTVLAVNTPEKILLHKVRVGPYQGADEMNRARAKLQLKGIASTPVRGQ